MLLLEGQSHSTLGSASDVALTPLALEWLRDDSENSPRWRLPPCLTLGRKHEVAHFQRFSAQPGGAREIFNQTRCPPSVVGMAPVALPDQGRTTSAVEAGRAYRVATRDDPISDGKEVSRGVTQRGLDDHGTATRFDYGERLFQKRCSAL